MKRLISGILIFCCILSLFAGVNVSATEQNAATYLITQTKNELTLKKNGDTIANGVVYDSDANRYIISAVSDSLVETAVRINITEFLKVARVYVSGRVTPSVLIKTDIADVTVPGEVVDTLAKKNKKKVWFEVTKDFELKNQLLKSLVEDAQFEINYCFVDENDNNIECDGVFDVQIPFVYVTTQNVNVYEVRGTRIVKMESKYEDSILSYKSNSFATAIISEKKRFEITGRTLDLQGKISLVFYATIEGVDPNRVKMLCWETQPTQYIAETADQIVGLSGIDKNGYRFEYENISSKEMSKNIYVRLALEREDGTYRYGTISREPYSVVKYAQNMMKNKALKPLLIKMLNYGAAAQEYFGSEDKPANSILKPNEIATDYTKTYEGRGTTLTENNGIKSDAYIAGKTISLDGDISINYYVLDDTKSVESGVLFWTEYDYANAKSHTIGTESRKVTSFNENGAYKVYSYDNIVSRQIYNSVYARAYTKIGNEYRYSDIDKYSICDYAANQINKQADSKLVKLLRCLMLYGEESKKFFDSLL